MGLLETILWKRRLIWQEDLNSLVDDLAKEFMGRTVKLPPLPTGKFTVSAVKSWLASIDSSKIEKKILSDILAGAKEIAEKALLEQSAILSFDGRVDAFKKLSFGKADIKDSFSLVLSDKSMKGYVSGIFDRESDRLAQLAAKGKVVGWDEFRKEAKDRYRRVLEFDADSLFRTYAQSVNNHIVDLLHMENRDLMRGVVWKVTSKNPCARCALLDGKTFPVKKHPDSPLHVVCKCQLIPKMVSFDELGVSKKEIKKAYRKESRGDFEPFSETMKQMSPAELTKILGSTRTAMYRQGLHKLDDFIDNSGQLKLIGKLL